MTGQVKKGYDLVVHTELSLSVLEACVRAWVFVWQNCEKVYDSRLSTLFFGWYGVSFIVVEVKERELSEKVTEGNHDERLGWG